MSTEDLPSSPPRTAVLKPLSELRVLDFTSFPPGAACTVMLADLGAEVVRVEAPAKRGKASLVIGQVALSRAKRSMTLDMRQPGAIEVLLRLFAAFDVVVESAKPGSMEDRGFGYSQARSRNPKIIWCAITGYGQVGPNSGHTGHDLAYVAHSGLLGALSGELPWHPGTMLAGPAGAQAAVIGIQSALLHRAQSGEGSFVDISLSEAAGWFLTSGVNALSDSAYVIPASPDRRLYACADGRFVAVTSAEPRTWEALCDGLGVPELKDRLHKADDAEFTANSLAAIFMTLSATEWVDRLAGAGAAVAAVNCASDLLSDPQVKARGSVVECGGVSVPANPTRVWDADGSRTETVTEGPHQVGQDTDYVLASVGFSKDEIVDLANEGLI